MLSQATVGSPGLDWTTTEPIPGVRTIQNPVLAGFHPDPSLIRVGEDFYLATATGEWAPGVALHHSRDLVHWRTLPGALDQPQLLDLQGVPDSGGICSPGLSFADGRFHLVFAIRHGMSGDARSYLVTSENIAGPWSEPIRLNTGGLQPSLFHDVDGRHWLLTARWDPRPGHDPYAGIQLQELSISTGQLLGQPTLIFSGTEQGVVEGPRLYRRGDWYYLLTAEGGSSYEHAVTVARSRRLTGSYVVHPANPLVTAFDRLELPLQKIGHASLVDATDGSWWMAVVCARPLTPLGRCVLGRETAILPVEWDEEDWPRVTGAAASEQVSGPDLPAQLWPQRPVVDRFDQPTFAPEWLGLRRPPTADWADLSARPGYVRLRGGESLGSVFQQSLLARRQQHHRCVAETVIEFDPISFEQQAGLVHYYQTGLWHYLRISWDEQLGRCIGVLSSDHGTLTQPAADVSVEGMSRIHLRAEIDGALVRFSYGSDGLQWTDLGPALDASRLSDEYATVWRGLDAVSQGVTGSFLGLTVQDPSGRASADFDFFVYSGVSD